MISNLLFMPMLKGILLFFLSLFVWWNLTFLTKKDKRLVASFSGDAAFAFLSFAFSFQLFFHWKDILTSPSYFFLLSARPTGIALICTAGYLGYKKISRLFDQPLFYQGWLQLLVTGTTVNHLYYAFMYGQLRSILSAGLGLAALFFLIIKLRSLPFLLVLTFLYPLGQYLLLKRTFLFFEFVFPSSSLLFAAGTWLCLLLFYFLKRRNASSLPN